MADRLTFDELNELAVWARRKKIPRAICRSEAEVYDERMLERMLRLIDERIGGGVGT